MINFIIFLGLQLAASHISTEEQNLAAGLFKRMVPICQPGTSLPRSLLNALAWTQAHKISHTVNTGITTSHDLIPPSSLQLLPLHHETFPLTLMTRAIQFPLCLRVGPLPSNAFQAHIKDSITATSHWSPCRVDFHSSPTGIS